MLRPDRSRRRPHNPAAHNLGQLNFYVAAVNGMVRFPGMASTVEILVCGSKKERTVRYASRSPPATTWHGHWRESLALDDDDDATQDGHDGSQSHQPCPIMHRNEEQGVAIEVAAAGCLRFVLPRTTFKAGST